MTNVKEQAMATAKNYGMWDKLRGLNHAVWFTIDNDSHPEQTESGRAKVPARSVVRATLAVRAAHLSSDDVEQPVRPFPDWGEERLCKSQSGSSPLLPSPTSVAL